MTREEAIARIKIHKSVHKMNEPRAIHISEALDMAIKALEQEPCEDAINRILKRMWNCRGKHTTSIDKVKMEQIIRDEFPPVTSQPKTGHWIVTSDGYGDSAYICECSKCKDTVWVYKDADRRWNYCPNCGSKNVIESEE